jgi:disulfide bond formation protein DsbB
MDLNKAIQIAKFVAIVIGVVALGMFALNSFMDYYFKNQLLLTPCELCVELNPHTRSCIYPEPTLIPQEYITNWSHINFQK